MTKNVAHDGFEPVPFWVAVVFGGLLAWGGFYVGTNSADFRRDVFDRSDLRMPEGGTAGANVPGSSRFKSGATSPSRRISTNSCKSAQR